MLFQQSQCPEGRKGKRELVNPYGQGKRARERERKIVTPSHKRKEKRKLVYPYGQGKKMREKERERVTPSHWTSSFAVVSSTVFNPHTVIGWLGYRHPGGGGEPRDLSPSEGSPVLGKVPGLRW